MTTSPAATPYTVTLAGAVTLPAGLANGSSVEVKSATQPAGSATNGAFKMFGGTVTVHVSDATAFDSGVANLTALAGIGATQAIEVPGYPTATGGADIVATRVKLGNGGSGTRWSRRAAAARQRSPARR